MLGGITAVPRARNPGPLLSERDRAERESRCRLVSLINILYGSSLDVFFFQECAGPGPIGSGTIDFMAMTQSPWNNLQPSITERRQTAILSPFTTIIIMTLKLPRGRRFCRHWMERKEGGGERGEERGEERREERRGEERREERRGEERRERRGEESKSKERGLERSEERRAELADQHPQMFLQTKVKRSRLFPSQPQFFPTSLNSAPSILFLFLP